MGTLALKQPRTLALYGGAFDPLHRGHEAVLDFLVKELEFREVKLLVAGDTAMKRPQTRAEHRLAMAEIALKRHPSVKIERYEVDHAGPHATTRTLEALGLSASDTTFVIGTDQFIKLEKWINFPKVLGQCHWLILSRKGIDPSAVNAVRDRLKAAGALKNGPDSFTFSTSGETWMSFVEIDAPEVSSSEIRREFALNGQKLADSRIASDIDAYLKAHELYGRVP